ncbi:MAG: hypothetical protein P8182_14950 [Deltaproteobacteria bacterium]
MTKAFAGSTFSGKLMMGEPHTKSAIPLMTRERESVAMIAARMGWPIRGRSVKRSMHSPTTMDSTTVHGNASQRGSPAWAMNM